jgi:hypothetical protein
MCEPTALAIGSFALDAGSKIAGASAQNKAANANKAKALEALRLGNADISARSNEETAAARAQTQMSEQAAQAGIATATTSAAESGVAGQSVDALVGEVLRQQGVAADATAQNLEYQQAQAQRDRLSLVADANSQIASVPKANGLATAVGVAGAGLGFLNTLRLQRGPKAPK